MDQSILKQLWWLKLYALLSGVCFLTFIIVAFTHQRAPQRFAEIDVERINFVEKDGTLKLVISNGARQHPGSIDGKPVAARQRPPGLIFFNTDGDECGGLVYDGSKKAASLSFSVDQYKNDQVMQLQYDEEQTGLVRTRMYGLRLWDRPDTFTLGQLQHRLDSLTKLNSELRLQQGIADMKRRGLFGYERLFVGKNRQDETGLFIRDATGRPRIQLYVNQRGKAVIELLDAAGKRVPFQ